MCRFDFELVYGTRGKGFIEVHHIVPIGTLIVPEPKTFRDLVAVCSNCHSMVHHKLPGIDREPSLEELSDEIERRKQTDQPRK